MALVLFGNGISDMRGSIAGNTYSKNRYGSYVRNRTKPVNPNSTRQQNVRNDLAYLVAEWSNTLSIAQRNAWATYATAINFVNKLGQTIKLTGFNHFIRSNVSQLANAFPYVPDGPVILTLPGTDNLFNVGLSEGTQLINIDFDDGAAWCSEDDGYMSIHQGLPQVDTRNFFGGPFRRNARILGNSVTPITSPQTVGVVWPVAVTQRNWVFGRIGRADGRLSVPFRDDAYVGA